MVKNIILGSDDASTPYDKTETKQSSRKATGVEEESLLIQIQKFIQELISPQK